MRIWDVSPTILCRQHLLAEHRELHAVWTVVTEGKSGYAKHPETKRWVGKLKALYKRHEFLVQEMERRGYKHRSFLDQRLATGKGEQDERLITVAEQIERLIQKDCPCPLKTKV